MAAAKFNVAPLERFSNLSTGEATLEAASWLTRLINDDHFLESQVLPRFDLLASSHAPTTIVLADGDGAYTLRAFHWPVGSATPTHDHGSWAVLGVVFGRLHEERFRQMDDGIHPDYARLLHVSSDVREAGRVWILMPHEGGIHRIQNLSGEEAISFHLYGPVYGAPAREFDPASDIDHQR